MENLPEEIVTEILSRLPTESIIQCKFVRKSWHLLFSNPNFVAKHLANQYQSSRNNNLVFLKRRLSYDDDSRHDTMCILSNHNIDDPEIVHLPSTIQLCGLGLTLIGHCDGLIALSDGKEGIIVCNPATREFRTLPNSSLGMIPYDDIVTHGDDGTVSRYTAYNNFLGFGYDCNVKDYKVVRVVTFYWCGGGDFTHRAEVFCIHTDSCWRELDVILDSTAMLGDYELREPYFDGVCYWWAEDDKTRQYVLTSFHMADEVFIKTPVPPLECFDNYNTKVSVGVYNDSIAMYIYPGGCDEIRVMKIGVNKSWSNLLTIEPFIGARHLAFWNGSDKEFLYVDIDGQLAIYNRATMESKSLSLRGLTQTWVAVPYMKTIVSVKAKEDIASSCQKLHL